MSTLFALFAAALTKLLAREQFFGLTTPVAFTEKVVLLELLRVRWALVFTSTLPWLWRHGLWVLWLLLSHLHVETTHHILPWPVCLRGFQYLIRVQTCRPKFVSWYCFHDNTTDRVQFLLVDDTLLQPALQVNISEFQKLE